MKVLSFSNAVPDRFVIFDLEYLADRQLFDRYARADPKPASCRWPFRRVIALSAMSVSVNGGVWEVDDFRSFINPIERDNIRAFFDWMRERPLHRAVTWSGAAEDLNILKTAALEFGFTLPPQLRQNERDRLGFMHLDLSHIMKAGSGTHVHQLELAVRLGLPGKMAGSAGQVPYRVAEGNLRAVAWISECDVLLTSCLLASHLVTLGQVMSIQAAHYVTMRYVRERATEANYHRELGNYIAKVERQMLADQRSWLEAG